MIAGLGSTVKALDAMASLGRISESETDKEDFELAQVVTLASAFDVSGDLRRRPELVERVLSTKAALRDPSSVGTIMVATKIVPSAFVGDSDACAKATLDTMLLLLRVAKSDPDPVTRTKSLSMA